MVARGGRRTKVFYVLNHNLHWRDKQTCKWLRTRLPQLHMLIDGGGPISGRGRAAGCAERACALNSHIWQAIKDFRPGPRTSFCATAGCPPHHAMAACSEGILDLSLNYNHAELCARRRQVTLEMMTTLNYMPHRLFLTAD